MLINITPKRVNKASDLKVCVTFQRHGVPYDMHYRSKGDAVKAIKHANDMFVCLVDMDKLLVVRRDDLKDYMAK